MKKLLFFAGLFIVAGIFGQVSAQDAVSVIERYNKAINAGQVDIAKTNMMVKMTMANMEMKIPCTVVMAHPTQRMRIEIEVEGQKMLIIISGEKGWMYIPGMGTQPLSTDQIKQYINQFDIFSNLKWNAANYDLKLLKSQMKEGKKYDVIDAKAKKASTKEQKQTVYFDNATGLLASIESAVEGGKPGVNERTIFENYKMDGKYVYPSEIRMFAAGKETGSITINALTVDYPVTDEMFAEPK